MAARENRISAVVASLQDELTAGAVMVVVDATDLKVLLDEVKRLWAAEAMRRAWAEDALTNTSGRRPRFPAAKS